MINPNNLLLDGGLKPMARISKSMLKSCSVVVLALGIPFSAHTAFAGGTVIGSGGVYIATERSVTLQGEFSGIVVGADRVHVNMQDAVVDCGGVSDSIGVDLGSYSRVHINGGTVQNCGVGIMAGARDISFTPPAGNNNHVNGVTVKDGLSSGSCCFVDGIAINGGSNNRIVNNHISNMKGVGVRIFRGSNNDVTGNTIKSFFGSDNIHAGIMIQDAENTSVHGNEVSTGGGIMGIRVTANTEGTVVTGNTAWGNRIDLWDDNVGCVTTTWAGNIFLTDGGAESDGPGAGCIR